MASKIPYEMLKTESERKGRGRQDVLLPIILAAAVLLCGALVCLAISILTARDKYQKYIEYASESTTYAYENKSMTASFDGETINVKKKDIYYIYNFIATDTSSGISIGNQRRKEPSRDADIVIAFGDGATASFWELSDAEKASYDKGETMFISYRNGSYSYMYSTGSKSFSLLKMTLTE